jgi:hypothetical protein
MKYLGWMVAALLLALAGCSSAQTRGQVADEAEPVETDDIKNVKTIADVTDVVPPMPVQVSGVGLVYGLDGTGGTPANSEWRQKLEEQLVKQGVPDVKAMLDSPKYSMVFVTASIPVGTRRGDTLDVEVTLDPQSKTTSLRGGKLFDCVLRDYSTTRMIDREAKSNTLLEGHILAKARGPLLVGFGEGNEEVRLRRGRIWEGAVSLIDMPFYIYLKDDQRFARVANEVAQRINSAFPDDPQKQASVQRTKRLLVEGDVISQINTTFRTPGGSKGETAKAVSKNMVHVNVPFEYRLCPPDRYLVVLRLIPLQETPEMAGKYRQRLRQMLLDPRETVEAALRLEALGKESIPALKKGLTSPHPLVRFTSAESLTYLGSTAGVDELARLADNYTVLRGNCLTALASLNESMSNIKLADMLHSPKPQVRYGAFRSLLVNDEQSEAIAGENIRNQYWLHKIAPGSESMVHLSTSRRAEIVLCGEAPKLVPPFRLPAGNEFTLTAVEGDRVCTISRYVSNSNTPHVSSKQCSFDLEEVLKVVALMGGEYPDAAELLRQVERHKCLTCPVFVDQMPEVTNIRLLAAVGGSGAEKIRNAIGGSGGVKKREEAAEWQKLVLAAQEDLGIAPDAVDTKAATSNSPSNHGTQPASGRSH